MMTTARTIEIVSYQARWVEEFRETSGALRAGLGHLALRIDHIGSTSVPGLGAKDCVDIQVTVAAIQPSHALAAACAAAGFQVRSGIIEDHRPPGDERPAAEWQKLFAREPEHARRTHIHVREAGRANQRYALLFRDFLRATRGAAAAYESVKRTLARLHPHDIESYLAVKDPVCDVLMAGAELWATAIAWQPGPSDA
ncbi:MAG: GrpB family protein [Myxococcales bacterium]|nr:GrpB family protein [Myxococcales bacterium]